MQMESAVLGTITYEETDIYYFANGLPGFEEQKQFLIIQPDPGIPFSYLQAVEDASVAMVVTDPFLFYKDYDFELPGDSRNQLQADDFEYIRVWSIVTIPGKLEDATINLMAPIVVNTQHRIGQQLILHDTGYKPRHPLIREASPVGGDDDARP